MSQQHEQQQPTQPGPGGTGESVPAGLAPQGFAFVKPTAIVKVFEEEAAPPAPMRGEPQAERSAEEARLGGVDVGGSGAGAARTESEALEKGAKQGLEGLKLDTAVGEAATRYTFLDHQPRAQLNSGHSMPLVGLGTWKSEKGEVKLSVEAAIRAGYRHIDCAQVYQNEHEIGAALQVIFKEGQVKREDLFITSKLWNSYHGRPETVKAGLQRTLRDLQLDYLDLYLVHWPVTGNKGLALQPPYAETWSSMERLVDQGLVRSIGVSNLSVKKLKELLGSCRIKPAVNQIEVHPFFRNDTLIQFCKEQGIHVTAYSPLGSPDSASVVKRKHSPSLLRHPEVTALAENYDKDVGQILIRWALQHGTSVLPKSVHPQRIKSNLDVLGWKLEQEDYDRLCRLEPQVRMVDGSFWLTPEGPYRTLAELWDDPEEDERQSKLVLAAYTNLNGKIHGVDMPTAKLNSGYSIPLVGLGTYKADKGAGKAAVEEALRMGYRHIDCASIYGNEDEIGEALSEVLEEGVIKREELFITSKLWNDDHEPDSVEAACRKTLQDLKLSYLDLYLIHWPVSATNGPTLTPPYDDTWSAMERLADQGLVRSIGVSNLSATKLKELLGSCRIKPAVNQFEAHPYFRNDALVQFCKEQGIHVTAYSPLGSPDSGAKLSDRNIPQVPPLEHPVVQEVAKKLHKTPGQVMLRWGLQRGTSVLPKSVNVDRLRSNIDIVGWQLTQEDFDRLSRLEPQVRMVTGEEYVSPQGPYTHASQLWDDE